MAEVRTRTRGAVEASLVPQERAQGPAIGQGQGGDRGGHAPMLPAAPQRSPDALTVLWTQEADGTDVDTGTADHFDKIFTDDPEPRRL